MKGLQHKNLYHREAHQMPETIKEKALLLELALKSYESF